MVPLQGYIPTLISTGADPERRDWLRWASESANTPMFVRMVAEAAPLACTPDYVLLCGPCWSTEAAAPCWHCARQRTRLREGNLRAV